MPDRLLSVKWGGAYLGVQNVAPFNHYRADVDSSSAYVNFIGLVGKRWSVQVEPIVPFSGEPPLLRLAADYKLW